MDDKTQTQKEQYDMQTAEIEKNLAELRVKLALLHAENAPIIYEYTIKAYDQRQSPHYMQESFVSKQVITLRKELPVALLNELIESVEDSIERELDNLEELKKLLKKNWK